MTAKVLEIVCLLLVGILAGEEFIVRYGLQPALNKLDERSHLLARIALVKKLKLIVPAIMLPAVVATILLIILAGEPGLFRWLGATSLLAFVLFSLLGTVPINIKVNDWDADAPPSDWKTIVQRWKHLDTYRSAAAVLAFLFLLISVASQGAR